MPIKDQSITDFVEQVLDFQKDKNSDFALGFVIGTLKERNRMKEIHDKEQNKCESQKILEAHQKRQREIKAVNPITKKQPYANRITKRETEIHMIKVRECFQVTMTPLNVKQIMKYTEIPKNRYKWLLLRLNEMILDNTLTKTRDLTHRNRHVYILTTNMEHDNGYTHDTTELIKHNSAF